MDSKEKKSKFSERLERLIAGRGYYVVLAVCALVIGVSVWSMLRSPDETRSGASASAIVAPVPADVPVYEPEDAYVPAQTQPEPEPTPDADPAVTLEDAAQTAAQDVFVQPVNGTVQRG